MSVRTQRLLKESKSHLVSYLEDLEYLASTTTGLYPTNGYPISYPKSGPMIPSDPDEEVGSFNTNTAGTHCFDTERELAEYLFSIRILIIELEGEVEDAKG